MMAKKPTKKGKTDNPQSTEDTMTVADNVNEPAPTPIETLRNEFLELNGGCADTALLAACQQLLHGAEHIQALEHSSIAGFNRRFDQNSLAKS